MGEKKGDRAAVVRVQGRLVRDGVPPREAKRLAVESMTRHERDTKAKK